MPARDGRADPIKVAHPELVNQSVNSQTSAAFEEIARSRFATLLTDTRVVAEKTAQCAGRRCYERLRHCDHHDQ